MLVIVPSAPTYFLVSQNQLQYLYNILAFRNVLDNRRSFRIVPNPEIKFNICCKSLHALRKILFLRIFLVFVRISNFVSNLRSNTYVDSLFRITVQLRFYPRYL